MEGEEDRTHNEEYTSGYSDQDDDKQGSGSDDRDVELRVRYALYDLIVQA